jgi:hypothetical protein
METNAAALSSTSPWIRQWRYVIIGVFLGLSALSYYQYKHMKTEESRLSSEKRTIAKLKQEVNEKTSDIRRLQDVVSAHPELPEIQAWTTHAAISEAPSLIRRIAYDSGLPNPQLSIVSVGGGGMDEQFSSPSKEFTWLREVDFIVSFNNADLAAIEHFLSAMPYFGLATEALAVKSTGQADIRLKAFASNP